MTVVAFPVSAAMDATASGGGPGTFLNWIIQGNPGQILKHVTDLLAKANEFAQLYQQLRQAGEQLRKVWRGPASDSASKKITTLLDSFTKIISVVREVSSKLGLAASIIQKAQLAFKSVVAAVNPTVAGLMSNPWTYGAAVALSTATSGALKAFLAGLGALLKTLGAVELAAKLTTIAEVIGHLEKLVGLVTGNNGGSGGSGGGETPQLPGGQQPVPGPGATPQLPGQPTTLPAKDFTDYRPPALGGNGSNMWIPVDPAPAPAPAPSPSPGGQVGVSGGVSVTVTTSEGSTTVNAAAGVDSNVTVNLGGKPVTVAIDGDGDGKVSA